MSVVLNPLVEVSPLTEDIYDFLSLFCVLDVIWDGMTMGPDEDLCSFVETLLRISGDDAEVFMLFRSLFCDIWLCYIV